jgi:hypothetical protein
MRSIATLAAAVAAALGLVAGPVGVARADDTAQDTISRLQRQGYTVQIDKIGTGPISECVVTSVRNPQTMTQWVPFVGPGLGNVDGNFLVPVVTSQTISVSLDCSQH